MNKALQFLLILLAFLLFTGILIAQNHMDIMTTMTGEYDLSQFGWIMTTLDWNGDGHDDLIVSENGWKPEEYQTNPNIVPFGKLFVYYGGTNFANVPEKVIEGQYQGEYGQTSSICNAGDVNGDGIDDLAMFKATPCENGNIAHFNLKLSVFYGGADPDTVADYELVFPRQEWSNEICYVRGLGDINHDGYDDIGYTMDPADSYSDYHFGIIYGGTNLQATSFLDAGSRTDFTQFCGLGDVNADGIDDFCIGYCYNLNEINHQRIVLYYGNTRGAPYDSLVVFDGSGLAIPFAFPAGDINNDGISDFTACYSGSQYRLYLGSQNLNISSYVTMAPSYFGDSAGWGFGYGDVNGDGSDDLIGTQVDWGSGDGSFAWWMGGNPMNGGADLLYYSHYPFYSMMFGFCLTMGDYNADGCCDAAISAPFEVNSSLPWNGVVYVFAGNTQLDDPLPVTDGIAPVIVKELELYPNPLSMQKPILTANFVKQSGNDISTFEIFNIRGQKVKSQKITAEQAKSGSAAYDLHDLASGVYICILQNSENRWQEKITMIK